jgi:hypothetical protein
VNRLFAEVYLDLVGDLLRARGFRAVTARDAGLLGQADSEQLQYAASHRMVILTHNRVDFEALHRQYLAGGQSHWGIVIAARRHPHRIAANLVRLLDRLTADELQEQLLYI